MACCLNSLLNKWFRCWNHLDVQGFIYCSNHLITFAFALPLPCSDLIEATLHKHRHWCLLAYLDTSDDPLGKISAVWFPAIVDVPASCMAACLPPDHMGFHPAAWPHYPGCSGLSLILHVLLQRACCLSLLPITQEGPRKMSNKWSHICTNLLSNYMYLGPGKHAGPYFRVRVRVTKIGAKFWPLHKVGWT